MTSQISRTSTPSPATSRPGSGKRGGNGNADARLLDMRARARTRPMIEKALRILLERYRLPDAETAFALLSRSSQHHNLRLRVLASGLVTAPPPVSADRWFPGRRRTPPPVTPFLRNTGAEVRTRSSMLASVLDTALEITQTANGDLQLVDPALDVLVMEDQRGFSADFLDFFAHVGAEGTACAAARRTGVRVSVPRVADDPIFAGRASRDVLLDAGSRAVSSTPIMDGPGRCAGIFSTHTSRAGQPLTTGEEVALDQLAQEAADWLRWYHRSVIADALEYLHRLSQSSYGRLPARTGQPQALSRPAVTGDGGRPRDGSGRRRR